MASPSSLIGPLLAAGLATALALFAPSVSFLFAPLLLGVPHLASGFVFLGRRISWSSHLARIGLVAAAVLVMLGIGSFLHPSPALARAELLVGALWVLLALGRSPLQVALVAIAILAMLDPIVARSMLIYGHNLVAVVAFLVLSKRTLFDRSAVALITGAGALVAMFAPVHDFAIGSIDLAGTAVQMFPGAPAPIAIRALVVLIDLQLVHYAVWLAWIPAGFGWIRELGRSAWIGIAVALLAVVAGASIDPVRARSLYLSAAGFHAYLELAALAYVWRHRCGSNGSR